MSEHQYIEFRAIDRPLTTSELAYARKQSSRAEISAWSFKNEYNFGDFRGDVNGLLQRGYDAHLHYANFGIRKIALRLPSGLPFSKNVWKQYVGPEGLTWKPDHGGDGGILTLAPYYDAGDLDEVWEFEPCVAAAVSLRRRLMLGDLSVLYLLWLVASIDCKEEPNQVAEPPVPAGLADLESDATAVLDFFGLDAHYLAAAAEASADRAQRTSLYEAASHWVQSMDDADAKSLLIDLLGDESASVKSTAIARMIVESEAPAGDTVDSGRTCQQLIDRAEQLREAEHNRIEAERRAAAQRREAKLARERQGRLDRMADDPKKWFRDVDRLVSARGTANYEEAAERLDELREALAASGGEEVVRKHAAHLASKNPTLSRLKSALRKRGLLG